MDDNIGIDMSKMSESDIKELVDFVNMEKSKSVFRAQVTEFNEVCWAKCMEYPQNKLDSKTETCIKNCVERFVDVTLYVANRFATKLQKSM